MANKTIYSDNYQKLLEIVKDARMASSLTQAEVAAAVGEDQSWISKIETGERRLDAEELRQLCDAIGIDLSEVILKWESALGRDTPAADRLSKAPAVDRDWKEQDWKAMVDWLVETGILSFREMAALTLGHLNPSQVGTSIASKKTFQKHFPPRKCWAAVRQWHFEQSGKCADCGGRLELQADHIKTRQDHGDNADRLENMTLRCRRCNVIRRPSHKLGGRTFLTAEAGLMFILLVKRPRTYQEFERLCREYGMTMANIRFEEAWAMAKWLAREGLYEIDSGSKF